MLKRYVQLITIICALLVFIQESPAPIYSGFPGLDSLIEQSSDIVIASLIDYREPTSSSIGGFIDADFHILKVLKGSHSEGSTVTFKNFRFLECSVQFDLPIELYYPGQYILFLKDKTNINSAGSSVRIYAGSNLSKINRKDIKETIALLIDEYVAYKEADLERIKKSANLLKNGVEKASSTFQSPPQIRYIHTKHSKFWFWSFILAIVVFFIIEFYRYKNWVRKQVQDGISPSSDQNRSERP